MTVEQNNSVSDDSRNMAVLMYILSICFWFIPSLVMFLTKKDDEFVLKNSVELLNYAITVTIFFFAYAMLSSILFFIPVIGWIIAILLSIAAMGVGLASLIFLILGALKVKEGEVYIFPIALRLLK